VFRVCRVWNRTVDDAQHDQQVYPLETITSHVLKDIDLVIEVAHPDIVKQYATLILQHCHFFIGSLTAFSDQSLLREAIQTAKEHDRHIFVPVGALWGAGDVKKMADMGLLHSVTVTMTKHPASFKLQSPLLEANELAKQSNETKTILYDGPIDVLCQLAPNNVNTMACVALAAHNLGFENCRGILVADKSLANWHLVEVEAKGPDGFEVHSIRKNPAKVGAVTGQLTYFSFLASVRGTIGHYHYHHRQDTGNNADNVIQLC